VQAVVLRLLDGRDVVDTQGVSLVGRVGGALWSEYVTALSSRITC
jgi:hypothetical protein